MGSLWNPTFTSDRNATMICHRGVTTSNKSLPLESPTLSPTDTHLQLSSISVVAEEETKRKEKKRKEGRKRGPALVRRGSRYVTCKSTGSVTSVAPFLDAASSMLSSSLREVGRSDVWQELTSATHVHRQGCLSSVSSLVLRVLIFGTDAHRDRPVCNPWLLFPGGRSSQPPCRPCRGKSVVSRYHQA